MNSLSTVQRAGWSVPSVALCVMVALGCPDSRLSAQSRPREIRVAIMPPVAALHIDRNGRVPDMKFVTAREDAARRLKQELEARQKIGRYVIVPQTSVTALLTDLGWSPPDLFLAGPTSDDSPAAAVLRGRKGETVALWEPLESLRSRGDRWTTYKHALPPGSPDGATVSFGLAAMGNPPLPEPDPDKARRIAESLDVDLLVYIELDEIVASVQDRVRTASGDFASSFNPMWPVETTSGYPWRQLARQSRYAALTERMPYRIQFVSGATGRLARDTATFGDSVRPILFEGEDPATVRHREPQEIVARAQSDALRRILQTLANGPGQDGLRVR